MSSPESSPQAQTRQRLQELLRLGELAAAEKLCRDLLVLDPDDLGLLNQLGFLEAHKGNYSAAADLFRRILAVAPHLASIHNQLGSMLAKLEHIDAALEHFEFASWLDPGNGEAWLNQGRLLKNAGRTAEARACFARRLAMEPDNPLLELNLARICAKVAFSNAEIDLYRQQLSATLERLIDAGKPLKLLSESRLSCLPAFELAYQGRDDLALKRQYAELFAPAFGIRDARPRQAGRQKIGFVVTAGHVHVFIRCMAGILSQLTERELELHIVCSLPQGAKRLKAAIDHPDISYLELPTRLGPAIEMLAQARFDLLYYWECGTDALNYFLPFARLARVQCTGWGWPVTSGIPNMDYFLSIDGAELPSAQSHYSEKLIRLPHLPTRYPRPQLPSPPVSREDFGLPAQARIYLCNQNLNKLHPDFDRLVAGILRQDPAGIVVLTGHRQANLHGLVRQRYQALYPDIAARVRLQATVSAQAYFQLIMLADVLLDSLHFSAGGNTTYDAFACGVPLVTLPMPFLRGRYPVAAYAQVGLNACIASDEADYIQRALRIANDSDYRRRLSDEMREVADALFDDPRPAFELEACLLKLCLEAD